MTTPDKREINAEMMEAQNKLSRYKRNEWTPDHPEGMHISYDGYRELQRKADLADDLAEALIEVCERFEISNEWGISNREQAIVDEAREILKRYRGD